VSNPGARMPTFRHLLMMPSHQVMDEEALVQALESGRVASAGLDVYEFEPSIHAGLIANPNVMLLPHMGTWTLEVSMRLPYSLYFSLSPVLSQRKRLRLRLRMQCSGVTCWMEVNRHGLAESVCAIAPVWRHDGAGSLKAKSFRRAAVPRLPLSMPSVLPLSALPGWRRSEEKDGSRG